MKLNITQVLSHSFQLGLIYTHPSSSYVYEASQKEIKLILTARNSNNYSYLFKIEIEIPSGKAIIDGPILDLGTIDSLDHKGTSYPCIFKYQNKKKIFYTGWAGSNNTPFINSLFTAAFDFNRPKRELVKINCGDHEIKEVGGVDIKFFNDNYYLFFTHFDTWQGNNPSYDISVAKSFDSINWSIDDRFNLKSINNIQSEMICRPSIIENQSKFFMFFCHRSASFDYKIGLAVSNDFFKWELLSQDIFDGQSLPLWCNKGQSYPHIFFDKYHDNFYLFFAGNSYGKDGFGFSKLKESFFKQYD